MPSLFAEPPLLMQAFPTLDRGVLLGINRIGQVLIVSAAVMAFYHESLGRLVPRWLQSSADFIRNLAAGTGWRWTKDDFGFEFPPEPPSPDEKSREDVEIGKQLLLSAVVLGVLLWFWGRGPLGWLAFPFEVAWRGVTVWWDVKWNLPSMFTTLAASASRFLGFLPLLYIGILLCTIVAKPYADVLSRVAERLSPGHIKAAISAVLAIGSFFVLVAT